MRCHRRAGFSHVDVAVVIVLVAIVAVLIGLVLMPMRDSMRSHSGRYGARCNANLSGLYKAMYVYSVTEKDWFPIAGNAIDTADAVGFREGDRVGGPAVLDNNVTASLWLMVRDGSVGTGQFICPESGQSPDILTTNAGGTDAAALDDTHDFLSPGNLSYSPINMHHVAARQRWTSAVPADYVLMADANNSDPIGGGGHTLSKTDAATAEDIRGRENSQNHSAGEGQNILRGDGSTSFASDPFQGRFSDNMYAMLVGGKNAPPLLGNSAGDAATDAASGDVDSVLMPLTGNGGVSLSGRGAP